MRVITGYPHYPQWRIDPEWSGWTTRDSVDGVPVKRVRHFVPDEPVGAARALSEISFGLRAVSSRWWRPEVVLAVSPALLSTLMVVERARLHRTPVGVVVQDIYSAGVAETTGGRALRLITAAERRTLRQAAGVAVIHDRFRDRLAGSLAVPSERITVIRNWTHVTAPPPIDRPATRAALGWGPESIVLHTGAMGEKQDLANVVAAARLAHQRGDAVRFVLLGDGGQRGRLEQLAQGVEAITFLDPVADDAYPAVLSSADLLLVNEKPGVAEMAVPSKLTSYFRAGLPVLAATESHSTTAEEVRAAGAGLVVPPGDPQALLDGALSAAHDPRRPAWGASARAYCERVLSEETALDAYEDWLTGLAERGRTRRPAPTV